MIKNKKKEKIFFVYPPSPVMNREDRCQQPTGDTTIIPPLPPVDMMSLSRIAKKYNYETMFKDYSLNNETVYDFMRDLRVHKPDFLVLNIASTNLENELSILSQSAELLENTLVIVKGAIFNFCSYSIMQKFPEIDIALRGDIEEAFEEIIQYKDLDEIKGNRKVITVNQGYTKCSTVVLGNDNFITEDEGIYQALIENGKNCLLIEKGHVKLDGYEYGFIGGAAVFMEQEKVILLLGNIKTDKINNNIIEFCKNAKIKIENIAGSLTDFGGAVII